MPVKEKYLKDNNLTFRIFIRGKFSLIFKLMELNVWLGKCYTLVRRKQEWSV